MHQLGKWWCFLAAQSPAVRQLSVGGMILRTLTNSTREMLSSSGESAPELSFQHRMSLCRCRIIPTPWKKSKKIVPRSIGSVWATPACAPFTKVSAVADSLPGNHWAAQRTQRWTSDLGRPLELGLTASRGGVGGKVFRS